MIKIYFYLFGAETYRLGTSVFAENLAYDATSIDNPPRQEHHCIITVVYRCICSGFIHPILTIPLRIKSGSNSTNIIREANIPNRYTSVSVENIILIYSNQS
jgi:hypothetical protein